MIINWSLLLAASFSISLFSVCYLLVFSGLFVTSVQEVDASMSLSNDGASSFNSSSPTFDDATTNGTQSNSIGGSDQGLLQIKYTGLIRSDISPDVAEQLGLNDTYPGVMVTEVIPGSPAEKSGIRGANMTRSVGGEIVRLGGDIIVAVDGNSSVGKEDKAFVDYLQNEKRVGDNITLTFLRDGKINQTVLTLGSVPDYFWYTDDDEGIRIKYPADWRVSGDNLRPGDIIKFFSPEENSELGLPTAAVFLKANPTGGITLDEVAANEMEGRNFTRVLNIRGTELAGLQAYESTYYEYGADRTLKVKSVFAVDDDQLYRINFAADTSKYDDYLPMFREMLKSFQLAQA